MKLEALILQNQNNNKEVNDNLEALIVQTQKNDNKDELEAIAKANLDTKNVIKKGNKEIVGALKELKPEIIKGKTAGDLIATLSQLLTGKDGHTPKKGEDYFTNEEIENFKKEITPKKGEDYIDGKDGLDGYTPKKGKDYFTDKEIKQIIDDILKQIPKPKDGLDGLDGEDGKDAEIDYDKVLKLVIKKLPKIEKPKEKTIDEFIKELKGKLSFNDLKDLPLTLRQAARDYDFLELTDTPKSYKGQAGKIIKVSTDEKGLEFVTPQSIEDVNWGEIEGNIEEQSDLKDILDLKWSLDGNTLGAKKTIGSIDNQDFGIITNNTERITVLKGGNVGIGTITPTSGALQFGIQFSGNAIFFDSHTAQLRWSNGSTFSNTGVYSGGANQSYKTYDGSEVQTRLFIKASNGNVGIGITNPSVKLVVKADVNSEPMTLMADAGYSLLRFADRNGATRAWVGNDTSGKFSFKNFVSDGDLYLTTTGNGNVIIDNGLFGVGITTPTAKVHILSTKTDKVVSKIQGADGQTSDLTQWLNSSDSNVARMTTDGSLYLSGILDVAKDKTTIEVIDDIQTEDWTHETGGTGTLSYDASDFIAGTKSLKLITAGSGSSVSDYVRKDINFSIYTDKENYIELDVKVDNAVNISRMYMYIYSSIADNEYLQGLLESTGRKNTPDGSWITFRIALHSFEPSSGQTLETIGNTFERIRFRFSDDGTPVTFRIGGIRLVSQKKKAYAVKTFPLSIVH